MPGIVILTKSEIGAIEALHKQDLSNRKIAEITGISRNKIGQVVDNTYLPPKKKEGKVITPGSTLRGTMNFVNCLKYRCSTCGGMIIVTPCPGCYYENRKERKRKEREASKEGTKTFETNRDIQ